MRSFARRRCRVDGRCTTEPSLKLVGEVPGTQPSRLEADERVAARRVRVRRAVSLAEVADRDLADGVAGRFEPGVAANLDSPVRRDVLVDHDARARIAAQVPHLYVVASRRDVEAAVAPPVPDRG